MKFRDTFHIYTHTHTCTHTTYSQEVSASVGTLSSATVRKDVQVPHITLFRRSMREDRRSNVLPLFRLKMRVTRALRHSVVSIEPLFSGQVKDRWSIRRFWCEGASQVALARLLISLFPLPCDVSYVSQKNSTSYVSQSNDVPPRDEVFAKRNTPVYLHVCSYLAVWEGEREREREREFFFQEMCNNRVWSNVTIEASS